MSVTSPQSAPPPTSASTARARTLAIALGLALTCAAVTACGGDGSKVTSPTGERDSSTEGNTDGNPSTGGAHPDAPDTGSGDSRADVLAELVTGLSTPRDLIFGPPGSGLDDELFVVSFEGAEATWIRNFGQDSQALAPSQASLVGAMSVDIDANGNFYFACMTPQMGAFIGVVTVRRSDNSVVDFQYRGLNAPTGVALDGEGGLYVFNRGEGSVVRIAMDDGAAADNHGVEVIAEGLRVTDEVLPNHLLVDAGGRLLICETGAGRVLVYEDDEVSTLAGPDQGLAHPVSIAQLVSGNYLVANHGDGMLVELAPAGGLVRAIDTGLGSERLQAVAVRGDGSVYVVDDRDGQGSVFAVDVE